MSLAEQSLLVEKAAFTLDTAKRLGAAQAQVVLTESVGESLTWRKQSVENITRERDIGLSLVLYNQQREGRTSISTWDNAAIEAAVAAAITASDYNEADECNGLPDKEDYASPDEALLAQLDLLDTQAVSLAQLEAVAQEMEAAALDSDARIVMSDGADASHYRSQFFLATSNGFAQGYEGSRQQRSISVLAREGDCQQTNYDYDVSRHWADARKPHLIGEEASRKALARLSPQKIRGGRYPVLFDASVAGSLFGHLLQALTGRMQYRQLSFLTNSIGKTVLPTWLSMVEQPHMPRGLYSAPFDAEGLPTPSSAIIRDGVIEKYILSVYSARRLNLAPTGNAGGVHNAVLNAAEDYVLDRASLLKHMHTGVIVTQLMGQGVNLLTGDYSRGASGFWVENGEIQHAVEGITVAGNLTEMLQSIVMLGDDVDQRGRLLLPSILIAAMTVAQ